MGDEYVAVSNEPWDMVIKAGPWYLEDPSQFWPEQGSHLMLKSEAYAAGYHFADGAGAGFAPQEPADQGDDHPGRGHKEDKGDKGEHGKRGKRGKHSGRGNANEQ
ncbi:hypothetical protein [Streptomyces sp. NPDC086776]|uniref:hypothetical protein n=1 Tax=Streptomyces sp. NPDC086776 TaxID=3365756 RepID=UPI00381C6AD2